MDDRIEQLLSGQYFKKYQEAVYSQITEQFHMTLLEVRILLFFDSHGSSNTAKDLVRIFHFTKSNVSKSSPDCGHNFSFRNNSRSIVSKHLSLRISR